MKNQEKTLAFVFPGQGSQFVGMLSTYAQQYPLVKETFDEASNALGKNLWTLIQSGPESELNQTVNTQPALLASGVALWRVWLHLKGAMPAFLAGHSLGEYTALVCADALSLADGISLVAKRGALMQEAVPEGEGAMAAILGLEDSLLKQVCVEAAQGQVVSPVNFNTIGQTVIAGNKSAVERAMSLAKERGAKKVVILPVSVPSHCDLMKPAALKMAQVLTDVKIVSPKIPVIHNVDVDTCSHPDDIRERLVQQLYCPVRWVETVERLANEGVQNIVECGPGKVLCSLIKRIDSSLKPMNTDTPTDLEAAFNLYYQ